ncbi:MAG TPA: hypothetical protein VH062_05220 [Polyangiaceae bacterium]|jgi:hypothetical protein|nr:hypothetical protein [Polyangiaceae bacterium]
MSDLADALLDAHVHHELERLSGTSLTDGIRDTVPELFRWLEQVRLGDVATRERIVSVIQSYVIELKVSGGITELAGEMSNLVFSSEATATTRIDEVVSPGAYGQFADKIAALEAVQRQLFLHVAHSSAFRTLAARLIVRMVADLVFRRVQDPENQWSVLASSLGEKLLPGLEQRVGAALTHWVESNAERLTRDGGRHLFEVLDPAWVRQMADEIWDELAPKAVGDASLVFTPQDLEDFVVLGYEFWLEFRKTRYFKAVSTAVVNRLFDKYEDESVRAVISDMGVTADMIAHELGAFLPPILEHALSTGFLEERVRAHLEPFYRSPAVTALLAARA